MESPKISAVLPCYNHKKYLAERIRSILNQTLPVSQIIFLDDASTDGSLELAKELLQNTKTEISIHSNSVNSGSPSKQWNNGVSLAKHPYIWIAETDDSCDARLLERLHENIISNQTVLSFAQSRYIDDAGKDLGSLLAYTDWRWPGVFGKDFCTEGHQFNTTYMWLINAIPNASSVLFSRHAYLKAGMANESMIYCGDWDCWIRMCEQGRIGFVAEELNFFRWHHETTRAKRYSAQKAAEFLACRLLATSQDTRCCIAKAQKTKDKERASERHRFGRDELQKPLSAFRSVNWGSVSRTRHYYQQLDRVPTISGQTWKIITCLSFYTFARQRIASRVARAHSHALGRTDK
ncbi:glycosyltransferase family 2 protein [Cyanobium sp. CH-040]|uniref:glycosyltransferase family 2 protein n=1 Tax=Cyanobium sp. CH-040 TaxID=2823708 RepID=UPI0037C01060|nr:glycosyltransferase family 2 protein [Cyanobium sp. CH-040]